MMLGPEPSADGFDPDFAVLAATPSQEVAASDHQEHDGQPQFYLERTKPGVVGRLSNVEAWHIVAGLRVFRGRFLRLRRWLRPVPARPASLIRRRLRRLAHGVGVELQQASGTGAGWRSYRFDHGLRSICFRRLPLLGAATVSRQQEPSRQAALRPPDAVGCLAVPGARVGLPLATWFWWDLCPHSGGRRRAAAGFISGAARGVRGRDRGRQPELPLAAPAMISSAAEAVQSGWGRAHPR